MCADQRRLDYIIVICEMNDGVLSKRYPLIQPSDSDFVDGKFIEPCEGAFWGVSIVWDEN